MFYGISVYLREDFCSLDCMPIDGFKHKEMKTDLSHSQTDFRASNDSFVFASFGDPD